MTQTLLLGLQVGQVLFGWHRPQWNALGNAQPEIGNASVFRRIVGQQSQARDAEVPQDSCAYRVVTRIDGHAEFEIGFNGVESGILQCIGAQFVSQADAATLMSSQVEDDTPPGPTDGGQRCFQLLLAIATKRSERVARQAFDRPRRCRRKP